MSKKILLCASVIALMACAAYVGLKTNNTEVRNTILNDVEAVASCELPDGFSANGHCVSNDRNQHFCSNLSGTLDCYQ